MIQAITNAFSGPENYAHKPKVEKYRELDWEKNGTLKSYWKEPRRENKVYDKEYPQPRMMSNKQIEEDSVLWDRTALITGPSWERGQRRPVEKMSGGDIDSISLSDAHDQNKDFHHMNENPWFKGNPYTVAERPIDDGIDYYDRNDISTRRGMLVSDFAIHGHNRETNLNRRMANMRSDFEAGVVPSRWKHDIQSIMPWDQLRDHSHNGKLYLPGQAPTNDNPLEPWYRPQEKTYEEYTNKTTVDAPGRIEMGLQGEKLFYHEKIHHLKRKDNDELGHWYYNGYMKGPSKDRVEGTTTNKRKNRILPDSEYYGVATGTSSTKGVVEGFASGNHANRNQGKELDGDILNPQGHVRKNRVVSAPSKAKTMKQHTESHNGNDDGFNQKGDKTEHFNYTTWAPIEKREEKLFAVWNSRIEGYVGGTHNKGGMVNQQMDDDVKLKNKREMAERIPDTANMQTDNQGTIIRNDKGIADGIKETFSNMYSTIAGQFGIAAPSEKNGMVEAKMTGKNTRKSEIENSVREQGNIENLISKTMSHGKMTGKNTKKSEIENSVREQGNVENLISKSMLQGEMTSKDKNRKRFVEGYSRNGAPIDRLSGNGYLLTKHEARETLRSKIINNRVGNAFKDFGIVSHEGISNINWHQDKLRKANVSNTGSRNNAPQKQDLGMGTDQINVDTYFKHQKEVPNQVINPQTRSHHALVYGNEGTVNRKGTNKARKVERAAHDGVQGEFGFIQPRFSSTGTDLGKKMHRRARSASRQASKISAAN